MIRSMNGQYSLMVTGWAHDDFNGECTFRLYDTTTTLLLWEGVFNYTALPTVSSTGEVALPQPQEAVYPPQEGDISYKQLLDSLTGNANFIGNDELEGYFNERQYGSEIPLPKNQ